MLGIFRSFLFAVIVHTSSSLTRVHCLDVRFLVTVVLVCVGDAGRFALLQVLQKISKQEKFQKWLEKTEVVFYFSYLHHNVC